MKLDGFSDQSAILRAGVYALCYRGAVVYVGKSKGMLTRVATHRSQWAATRRGKSAPSWLPVKGILFDEIHVRPCSLEAIDSLEEEMINRFKPKYNTQLKNQDKIQSRIPLEINGVKFVLNQPRAPDEPTRIARRV